MVKNFSVLIPVYNFNVFPLVEQLDKIAHHFDSSYEILLIDDNSSSFFKEKNNTNKAKNIYHRGKKNN